MTTKSISAASPYRSLPGSSLPARLNLTRAKVDFQRRRACVFEALRSAKDRLLTPTIVKFDYSEPNLVYVHNAYPEGRGKLLAIIDCADLDHPVTTFLEDEGARKL